MENSTIGYLPGYLLTTDSWHILGIGGFTGWWLSRQTDQQGQDVGELISGGWGDPENSPLVSNVYYYEETVFSWGGGKGDKTRDNRRFLHRSILDCTTSLLGAMEEWIQNYAGWFWKTRIWGSSMIPTSRTASTWIIYQGNMLWPLMHPFNTR